MHIFHQLIWYYMNISHAERVRDVNVSVNACLAQFDFIPTVSWLCSSLLLKCAWFGLSFYKEIFWKWGSCLFFFLHISEQLPTCQKLTWTFWRSWWKGNNSLSLYNNIFVMVIASLPFCKFHSVKSEHCL